MTNTARHRTVDWFVYSAAVILLITAGAKLFSASGSVPILTATDQVLHLPYRAIMLGAGSLEVLIAGQLLVGHNLKAKLWLVLWLSSNFMMYHFVTDFLHVKVCPCLGTIESMLPLSKDLVDLLLNFCVFYLFFGSLASLLAPKLPSWGNHHLSPEQPAQGL